MSYAPINSQSSFLPVEFALPKDESSFIDFICKRERLTADIVNIKENGNYENNEILSGQQYFAINFSPKKNRYTYRTVVNFGALPNAMNKAVAHGINITNGTIFTRIYATATQPGTSFIPIPYASNNANDNIELFVDTTNVNITTASDWTAYVTCYVVLEYIKA
jgi:hypothetical protein